MPLPGNFNSGDFLPFIQSNAKDGAFYATWNQGEEKTKIELPTFVIDFATIWAGGIDFRNGAPKFYPFGTAGTKEGYRMIIFGSEDIQGKGRLGLREWCTNAAIICKVIQQLFADKYEEYGKEHPNDIPVVKCVGWVPTKGGGGSTNHAPTFEVEKWVSRDLVPGLVEAPRVQMSQVTGVVAPSEDTVETFTDDDIPF